MRANGQGLHMAENPAEQAADLDAGTDELPVDTDALRAEVLKWQERVPKLANALRERSEEVAALRRELRDLAEQSGASDSTEVDRRLQARNAHIAELEQKLTALTAKHRSTAGELHTLRLTLNDAEEETAQWKQKWQEGTEALDAEANESAALKQQLQEATRAWQRDKTELEEEHTAALARLAKDLEQVKKRNAQLQETTEFANKQIATLGEELQQLVQQVAAQDAQAHTLEQAVADKSAAHDAVAAELEQQSRTWARTEETLQQRNAALEEDLRAHDARIKELSAAIEAARSAAEETAERLTRATELETTLRAQIEALEQSLETEQAQRREEVQGLQASQTAAAQTHELQLDELKEEIERLSGSLESAQRHQNQFENERGITQKLATELRDEVASLRAKLKERSALVLTLEEEAAAQKQQLELSERLLKEASGTAEETEQRAGTYKEHVQALELRLSDQRDLMQRMEEELRQTLEQQQSQVKQAIAKARESENRAHEITAELETAQNRVTELETANAQLKVASETARSEAESSAETAGTAADDLVRVRDQLQAARAELVDAQASLAALKTRASAGEKAAEQHSEQAAQWAQREKSLEQEIVVLTEQRDARIEPQANSEDGDIAQMQSRYREMELMLRDRTEELNELRWRSEQNEASHDENIVMILNQQLKDAREELARMKSRGGDVKAPAESADEPPLPDLTALKGLGDKLAEQLAESGFKDLTQIAALEPDALEDEAHPLHAMRSRIVRDDWIGQAREICGT